MEAFLRLCPPVGRRRAANGAFMIPRAGSLSRYEKALLSDIADISTIHTAAKESKGKLIDFFLLNLQNSKFYIVNRKNAYFFRAEKL